MNLHKTFFVILFFALFAGALWIRFELPMIPISDPDTWGYLRPALSSLSGEGMLQTHGRGMSYPLFLRWAIGPDLDFERVVWVQKMIGWLAGFLWLGCWLLWTRWLPEFPFRFWILNFFGIAGLLLYLLNGRLLFFEMRIRPEGIFPFFSLLQVFLMLLFTRWRWGTVGDRFSNHIGGFCIAAMAVAVAALCFDLKPSWGFSAMIPMLLLLLGVFLPGGVSRRAVSLGSLAAGGLVVLLAKGMMPAQFDWKSDLSSKSFLPRTLFTVHAPAIFHTLQADPGFLKLENADAFLQQFDALLKQSRFTDAKTYNVLGHDPDFLMYRSPLTDGIAAENEKRRNQLMQEAYFRAWLGDPAWMTTKVAKQLRYSMADAGRSLYYPEVEFGRRFTTSRASLEMYADEFAALPVATRERLGEVMKKGEALDPSGTLKIRTGPSLPRPLTRGIIPAFLAAFALLWPLAAGILLLKPSGVFGRFRTWSLPWNPAIWNYGIFWTIAMGTTLSVALTHSFDQHRYVHLLAPQHSLMLFAGLALIAGAILCSRK